jgi:hypothetical protein
LFLSFFASYTFVVTQNSYLSIIILYMEFQQFIGFEMIQYTSGKWAFGQDPLVPATTSPQIRSPAQEPLVPVRYEPLVPVWYTNRD